MSESTLEIVQGVFVDKLDYDPKEVATKVILEAELKADLDVKSLEALILIMALEDVYGLEVDPELAETLVTVGDVVALIDSLTK